MYICTNVSAKTVSFSLAAAFFAHVQCSDLEHRLRSLQSDYSALQEAHDRREEERQRALKELRDHMATSQGLKEKLERELREAREEVELVRGEMKRREEQLTERPHNALEQSETLPHDENESLQVFIILCVQIAINLLCVQTTINCMQVSIILTCVYKLQ